MKKYFKQIMAGILAVALVFSTGGMQVSAKSMEGVVTEIVYVDGNAIKVTIDIMNDKVIAESVEHGDESALVICEGKESVVTVYDVEDETFVEHKIDVDTLTQKKLDLTLTEKGGKKVKYDKHEDIIKDSYSGQAAITVVTTITVGTLITAVLATAACIIVAGVIYYAAKAAVAEIERSKETKAYYYKAYIHEKNVFVNLNKISYTSAVSQIKSGQNVYTYYASNAKKIVTATGLGSTSSEISDLKGKIRFYHYHTANRNGAHSFYGVPYVY